MSDNIITASAGKVFKRKSDGLIYDDIINLGYTHYINGIRLETPHLEVPQDFEEIDKTEVEE